MLNETNFGSLNHAFFESKPDDYVPAAMNEVKEVNDQFLKMVRKQEYLSFEDEVKLIKIAQGSDDKLAKKAEERIVLAYLRMCMKTASIYFRKHSTNSIISKEDLSQEATEAMLTAIKKYDVEQGVRFSTYAIYWIRAQLQNFVHNNKFTIRVSTSSDGKKIVRNYKYVYRKLMEEHSNLTEDEFDLKMAEAMNVSVTVLKSVKPFIEVGTISLDARLKSDDDSSSFGDSIADTAKRPDEIAELNIDGSKITHIIQSALYVLDEREKEIITGRYLMPEGETLILDDLAKKYGVSRERIRQIEVKALDKIKRVLVRTRAYKTGSLT